MTIRFTSVLLIGAEIDVYLKERSNLLQPNYVKLVGSRSIAQQRNGDIIHNMKSFDAGIQDRLDTSHADILMSIKMSHA